MAGIEKSHNAGHPVALTAEDPSSALAVGFGETARILFSAGSVQDTLQRVVDVAVDTIDGCDFAGIFLLEGGTVTTPVHTDQLVAAVDAVQREVGEGPCLDAIKEGGVFYAEDLADDRRWASFGPRAGEAGMRSLLALCLSPEGVPGALNLYARYPHAFGVIDRARALLLAGLAGLALSSAHAHEDEQHRLDNLQEALVTREVIGQAQGILMERELSLIHI